jgi:hypothetical protein
VLPRGRGSGATPGRTTSAPHGVPRAGRHSVPGAARDGREHRSPGPVASPRVARDRPGRGPARGAARAVAGGVPRRRTERARRSARGGRAGPQAPRTLAGAAPRDVRRTRRGARARPHPAPPPGAGAPGPDVALARAGMERRPRAGGGPGPARVARPAARRTAETGRTPGPLPDTRARRGTRLRPLAAHPRGPAQWTGDGRPTGRRGVLHPDRAGPGRGTDAHRRVPGGRGRGARRAAGHLDPGLRAARAPGEPGETRRRLLHRLARPHLPQGAPASPAVANLLAHGLDRRLTGLAAAVGARYGRYADDLVFSGDRGLPVHGLLRRARDIAADEGFSVLRALLHNCARTGPDAQNRAGHPAFRDHLLGRIAWVASGSPARDAAAGAVRGDPLVVNRLRALPGSARCCGGHEALTPSPPATAAPRPAGAHL